MYKEEAKIQRIKTLEKLSFVEAKKKVRSLKPDQATSYAQPTKNSSEMLVKDIVRQMLPDISEICTKIIKSYLTDVLPPQIPLPGVTPPSSKTATASAVITPAPITEQSTESCSSKRKQSETETISPQDVTCESEASQSSSFSQPTMGRPRKRRGKTRAAKPV